ncbi:MAG: hypothetical protein LBO03_03050 [Acidaminococcales bacterium]|jgi:hypothetical protein|nr:hypothetical protein [Acidaminococcales bacterium]
MNAGTKSTWGGTRKGSGRKALPPERKRKMRSMVAFDDEWALIKAFERMVKKVDREAAEKFIETFLEK